MYDYLLHKFTRTNTASQIFHVRFLLMVLLLDLLLCFMNQDSVFRCFP